MRSQYLFIFYLIAVAFGLNDFATATTVPTSFNRPCARDGDCSFRNTQARNSVFLVCTSGKCVCRNPSQKKKDVALYDVALTDGTCVVKGRAPCGATNGVNLSCDTGRSCIEGRCRSNAEIKSTPLNYSCYETIDCQENLICKKSDKRFPIMYYCSEA